MDYNTLVHFEQGGKQLTVELGGTVDVKAGGILKLGGTVLSATGDEVNQYALTATIADAGTLGDIYIVVPHAGTIKKLSAVNHVADTTTKTVLTAFIGTDAITHPAWEIALAAVAGTKSEVVPSAANVVAAGSVLKIHTDGGTDATMPVTVTVLIER